MTDSLPTPGLDADPRRRTLLVEHSTSTGHRLLHYEGACANLHGHNLDWTVEMSVRMAAPASADETRMPVDLKAIRDVLDAYDHALVLNRDDPLASLLAEHSETAIVTIEGDPTCENVVARVAERLVERFAHAAPSVRVALAETDKYAVSATATYDADGDADEGGA